MRFLHTADWQLGMRAAQVGDAGTVVREKRLLALENIAEVARINSIDFILVAGDTFDNNGVARPLVQNAADIMSRFNFPIYIIPGNHDPLSPGSVWEHPAWKAAGNITILRKEDQVKIPSGLLFPCPVREKCSDKDPTAWIHTEKTDDIKIGMAHGTVEGIHQEEPDHPIPRDAAIRTGLDYLALGHWHSTATYPASDGTIRMAYSGTHETTKFGERDSGNVLIVDIPGTGAPPKITTVHTGNLSWNIIEKDIRESGDLTRILNQIESTENSVSTLIELRLSGLLAANDYDNLNRIKEILSSSRFLFAHMDTSMLRPSPEDENWVANLPYGMLRNTATRLRELADPEFSGERPQGASPEVASRALLELYALVTEVST